MFFEFLSLAMFTYFGCVICAEGLALSAHAASSAAMRSLACGTAAVKTAARLQQLPSHRVPTVFASPGILSH